MKQLLALSLILLSTHSFGASVLDSMYEKSMFEVSVNRDPASNPSQFCLVNNEQKVFAKSCYSSLELCTKRLEFWKDLPGAKNQSCAKI